MVTSKPLQTKHWLVLLTMLFFIVLIAHLAAITSASASFGIKKSEKLLPLKTRLIEQPVAVSETEKVPEIVSPPNSVKTVKAKNTPALLPTPADAVATPVPPPTPPFTAALPVIDVAAPVYTPLQVPAPESAQAKPSSALGDASLQAPTFTALSSGLHTYKVIFTRKGISNQGIAELLWRQDGDKYMLNLLASYTLLIKTFKVFEQNSTGQLSPQGLEPMRFSDKRLTRSEVAAHFDRDLGKIIFSANTPDAQLQAGAQDRLSVIWQLAGMLAADPTRYPPGSTVTMQTVSATDAEPWLFTINEPETLNLPTGSHIARLLTRNPRREFDQKIELWFASSMNYLPVRFRFTETNGDYVDVLWQSVQPVPSLLF
jgi:Protein of unknown function (DUF3108)